MEMKFGRTRQWKRNGSKYLQEKKGICGTFDSAAYFSLWSKGIREQRNYLIDTGVRTNANIIESYIHNFGNKRKNINMVLQTNFPPDHMRQPEN